MTLDGQTRALSEQILVIADASRAVAVAGVMGGANTEVRESTRTVLLESAYFAPGSIRRTAKALGLSTEASYRFERGADIEGLRDALDRAARLIAELGEGRVAAGVLDAYPAPRRPLAVPLRLARIERVVGACPPPTMVADILRGLGFPATQRDGGFEVVVPAFRRDVAIEDDLVEEVARIWGYEKIPSTLPSGALALTRRPRHMVARDAVRRVLTGAGCYEAVSLSLTDPAHLRHLGLAPDDPRVVRLQNPLATDRSVMRPTLLFGLLEALATNVRRQAPDVRLFEIGRVFEGPGAGVLPREDTRVGIVLTGLRAPRAWHTPRARVDVFDAKGAVESLVEALGRGEVSVGSATAPYLEDGRAATVVVQGAPVGDRGRAPSGRPEGLRPVDAGLRRRAVAGRDRGAARPRDPVPAAGPSPGSSAGPGGRGARWTWRRLEVGRAIEAIRPPWLKRVALFDVYEGAQVGPGRTEPRLCPPLPGRRPDAHRRRGQPGAWRGGGAAPGRARRRGARSGRLRARGGRMTGTGRRTVGQTPPSEGDPVRRGRPGAPRPPRAARPAGDRADREPSGGERSARRGAPRCSTPGWPVSRPKRRGCAPPRGHRPARGGAAATPGGAPAAARPGGGHPEGPRPDRGTLTLEGPGAAVPGVARWWPDDQRRRRMTEGRADVEILGQRLSVRGRGTPEYIQELAQYLSGRIQSRAGPGPGLRPAATLAPGRPSRRGRAVPVSRGRRQPAARTASCWRGWTG